VTGLIGRVNHENYHFKMTTATIGVRGTGFDAWCNGACATGGAQGAAQSDPLKGAGVYVWSGQVALNTATASQLVSVGQAAILGLDLKPVAVTTLPAAITQNKTPRPDAVKVDMQKEFENEPKPDNSPASKSNTGPSTETGKPGNGTTAPEAGGKSEPGVYVTVHDGQVIMTQSNGQTLDVFKGQTGFANIQTISQMPATPKFMRAEKQMEIKEIESSGKSGSGNGPTQSGCVVK
jgi:hypothetical protein